MTNKDLQKVKEELLNDTHEDNKEIVEKILDNTIRGNEFAGGFTPDWECPMDQCLLPIIKGLVESIKSLDIIGMQPIDGPSCQINSTRINDKGDMVISNHKALTQTRALPTRWSTINETSFRDKSDWEKESLIEALIIETKTPIQEEIFQNLRNIADNKLNNKTRTLNDPSADDVADAIVEVANEIGEKVNQEKGKWIVVGGDMLQKLLETDRFEKSLEGKTVGIIDNCINVYVDIWQRFRNDDILVGHKGDTETDAGLFYCPFEILKANKSVEITIDDNPGEPEIAFASRYAFVELESDNSIDYYGKVIVNNLTV